jgi:hypothetical protein
VSKRRRPSKPRISNESHLEQVTRFLERRGPTNEYGAPTPERLAKARDTVDGYGNGQKITPGIILTDAGNPTGHYHWRITPVIDTLEKRGTLTADEYDAALRYMRHYAGSRHRGPATSKLMPYYDRGFQDLEPAERAIAFGQAKAAAEKSVHKFFHPALRWLEAAAEDEQPLWMLGQVYYPHLSKSAQSAKSSVILHFTLAMLAEHYGFGHRFSVNVVEEAIRTMRITVEFEEKIIHRSKKV